MLIPLGCYQCDHCARISDVYEHSVCCDTCADHICPNCIHNPEDIESDDTGLHATCEVCWQSEQEPGETREAYER